MAYTPSPVFLAPRTWIIKCNRPGPFHITYCPLLTHAKKLFLLLKKLDYISPLPPPQFSITSHYYSPLAHTENKKYRPQKCKKIDMSRFPHKSWHEVVYVTIGNPAFCLALYLTGVHFWGELQHIGDVNEQKI